MNCVQIGNIRLIHGDFWDRINWPKTVRTVITDPPFEVYSAAWAEDYFPSLPKHNHNLLFSKQPHTHRINYWAEGCYMEHRFLNDYIWHFTDGGQLPG